VTIEPAFHYICRTSACKGKLLCWMNSRLHYCVICRRTLCGKGSRCVMLEMKYRDAIKTTELRFLEAAYDYWVKGRESWGQDIRRWVRMIYDIGTFDVCDACLREWDLYLRSGATSVTV
jgi:hypothetical protein